MLNVNQKIELIQRTLENVQYEINNGRNTVIDDTIIEVTDQFVSPYYEEIVKDWYQMGAPEPRDYELDPKENSIYTLMTIAILETTRNYLYEVITDLEADAKTHHDTLRAELDRLRIARGYETLAQAIIE